MGFDWHNYIKIEPSHLYNSEGQLRANITPEQLKYDTETRNLLIKTLDQMAALPEFQKMLLAAAENGPERLIRAENKDRLEDTRLSISISEFGGNGYNPNSHAISLNSQELSDLRNEGGEKFSLQAVIFHETFHAADPNLNDPASRDLHQKKEAFQATLKGAFEKYPQLEEEYRLHGTILSRKPDAVMAAKTPEEFDREIDKFQTEHSRMPLDDFDNRIQWLMNDNPRAGQGVYLSSAFADHLSKIVEREDEIPAMDATNGPMAKYYGENPRIDYGTSRVPAEYPVDYAERLEEFRKHIHASVDPASGVQAPQIEGVHFDNNRPAAATPAPQPVHSFN